MGAWIETYWQRHPATPDKVAPRVGAWIETFTDEDGTPREVSLPVWERGLKLARRTEQGDDDDVAPRVGAWIETPGSR